MTPNLPDPRAVAQGIAENVHQNYAVVIDGPLDRTMADAPWADRDTLFSGLTTYQQERLTKIPPSDQYPEAKPWVEHVLAVDRELRATGLGDWEIAVISGINDYLQFRGYRLAAHNRQPTTAPGTPAPGQTEKCRVTYLPETDQGAVHAKNLDDPATFWRKDRTGPTTWSDDPWQHLMFDGVGSGLHLDDEPEEIFPLPVWAMIQHFCDDVPSAVEFMTRYGRFMNGFNTVAHDRQRRAVAIEKCSRGHIEFFYPTAHGRAHVSGMACRDPRSPQARHQRAMREEYLRISGRPWDAVADPDVAFWDACDTAERMLGDFMGTPQDITVDALAHLLTTPFPEGLCKNGYRFHPRQAYIEYTLRTSISLIDKRRILCWQREDPPMLTWPSAPEIYQF